MQIGQNPVALHAVRCLGSAPARAGERWFLVGQDGGQSIQLDGKTLWLFADTLLGKGKGKRESTLGQPLSRRTSLFLGNCAALSESKSFQNAYGELKYFLGADGFPKEVLRPTEAEFRTGHRLWPAHGLFANGTVYLFYLAIRQTDATSTWGFRGVGSGLAVLDPTTGESERVTRDGSTVLFPMMGDELHFGVQVIWRGDMVYVYSSKRTGLYTHALLARVRLCDIENPAAYEFLASEAPVWSADRNRACELALCSPEFSVSFNPYLDSYLMVYVDGYSKQLCLRTASERWGPFSEPSYLGVVPHRESSKLVSLGFEHPQFAEDNGRTVYISYCQPGFTQNSLVAVTFA